VIDLDTLEAWWVEALDGEVDRVAAQNPGFPIDEWRTAGRVTKANPRKEDLIWWRENGATQVAAYATWLASSGWRIAALPDGTPAVEFPMKPLFGGREIFMFVDAVYATPENCLVVVDYKSGSAKPDSAAQLGLYAAALKTEMNLDAPLGGYFLTRTGGLDVPHDLTGYTPRYWDDVFGQFFEAVDNRIFLPNISRNCSYCSVASACKSMGGDDAARYDPLAGAPTDYEMPGHASYSQLSAWSRCGKAFQLERLVKVPSRPGVYLAAGSAVHTVIERINRHHFEEIAA